MTTLSCLEILLRDMYIRILDKIPKGKSERAAQALSVIVAARQPLSLDEISMAIRFLPHPATRLARIPSDEQVEEGNNWVLYCANLLRIDGVGGGARVDLIHQSVKDFLGGLDVPLRLHPFRISDRQAKDGLHDAYVSYLASEEIQNFALVVQRSLEPDADLRPEGPTASRTICVPSRCSLTTEPWVKVAGKQLVLLKSAHEASKYGGFGFRVTKVVSAMLAIGDQSLAAALSEAFSHRIIDLVRVLRILVWALRTQQHGYFPDEEDLLGAARNGDRALLEALLYPASFCFNIQDSTALVMKKAVENFVLHASDVNKSCHYDVFMRLLHSFCWYNIQEIMFLSVDRLWPEILSFCCLEVGGDVLAVDGKRRTLLHRCLDGINAQHDWLDEVPDEIDVRARRECIVNLLASFASKGVLMARNERGATPLHLAVEAADDSIVRILVHADVHQLSLTSTNNKGQTPLHCITSKSREDDNTVANTLLDTDVGKLALTMVCRRGCTPLQTAMRRWDFQMIKTLLEADEDKVTLELLGHHGGTVLHSVAATGDQHNDLYLLELLNAYGCTSYSYRQDDDGRLPIHEVVRFCRHEGGSRCVSVLLQADTTKTTIFAADKDGRLPLHFAAMGRFPEAVRLLLEADECNFTVYTTDNRGRVPLHYATDIDSTRMGFYGQETLDTVQILTEANTAWAALGIKDKDGATPLNVFDAMNHSWDTSRRPTNHKVAKIVAIREYLTKPNRKMLAPPFLISILLSLRNAREFKQLTGIPKDDRIIFEACPDTALD